MRAERSGSRMGAEQLSPSWVESAWKLASGSGFSGGGGNIPRIPKRSAADEDRDEGDTQGELGQASSAHDSSFRAPSPAIPELWAGMGSFIVYHPLYTTNGDKSQEGERKSRMDR